MSIERICPDNLLARARLGTISASERGQLHTHLATCASCRAALTIGRDFDTVLGAQPGDELLAARIANLIPAPQAKPVPAARKRRRALIWIGIAAALVLLSSGSFAAVRPALFPSIREWLAPTPTIAPPIAPAPSPEPEALPPTPPPAPEIEEPPSPTAGRAPRAPPAREPAPSAADLFARANSSRRNGEIPHAIELYGELQHRYPASTEAVVSRVSLGRLLLDRMHDPAGALAQFDRYLAQSSHTSLAEEALFGRATALGRLGRRTEERQSWATLLARYPGSVYAERARIGQEP